MNSNILRTIPGAALLAGVLLAQAPTKQDLAAALASNASRLAGYQWTQKVTVIRKGEAMEPLIEAVRVDAAGNLNRTTVVQPPEKKLGPLAARKAAAVKAKIQGAMSVAGRYANPQVIAQAVQRGELSAGPGTLRFQARSLIDYQDEIVMQFDAATKQLTNIDIKAQHEGDPIRIRVVCRPLSGGPNVATHMTVQIPTEDVVVSVESTEHRRTAGL